MHDFTAPELEAAQKAIRSAVLKQEKVLNTLSQKDPPRTAQMKTVSHALQALRLALKLIDGALLGAPPHPIPKDDAREAARTIALLSQRVEQVLPKLKEGTPQHTLAVRRIKAFQIALALMEAPSAASPS